LDGTVKQAFATGPFRIAIVAGLALLCAGCARSDMPVLFPDGLIALIERDLMFAAAALILIVMIPVYLMAFGFSWHYRASNTKARYEPDWSYSFWMDSIVWVVPAIIIVLLGTIVWNYTHRLDPYKKLASTVAPLEVQVVAQDWKWLFIYPEQNIAVVNELVFPSGTPLSFKITSDTVMNSFYLPALGGQIFAMAGMQTRLHLVADKPGQFTGRNSQYSGNGFSKQYFGARATTKEEFDAWVAKVKQSPNTLDATAYVALAKKSIAHPVTYYSTFEPNLFDKIIAKYAPAPMHAGHATAK
jgi:cytochrome o ubiquinol oxidase subunit 2